MQCYVCQGNTLSELQIKKQRYYSCCECGSIILDPLQRLDTDHQKERYELHENSLEQKGYRVYLEKFFDDALSVYRSVRDGKPEKILDYGSGPEPCLVQLMKKKGYNAAGWDPFFCTDEIDVNDPSVTFDLITCLEVAEHFENPRESFHHISSLVTAGGVVVIGTNLIPDPLVQPFESWWYRYDPTHVTFYTLTGLQQIAASSGLKFHSCVTGKVFAFIKQ